MNIRIAPYAMNSKGAAALKAALLELGHKCLLIRKKNSSYKENSEHVVINWGRGDELPFTATFNGGGHINTASNKLRCLKALFNAGVKVPSFTTDAHVALTAVQNGEALYCRTEIRANSGKGIVIAANEDEFVEAPLYTSAIDIKAEYRVHVLPNGTSLINQKRRRRGREYTHQEKLIRNHANGWVFVRNNVDYVAGLEEIAHAAIEALKLDFGAVDIVYNGKELFVLEVNTAPGIEGSVAQEYAKAFVEAGEYHV